MRSGATLFAAAGAALAVFGLTSSSASADLLASYKFNNTSATNVPDDSGNGHTGTFFGTAGYNTANTAPGVGGAGSLSVGTGVSGVSLVVSALNSFTQLDTNDAGTVVFWQNDAANNQTQFNFKTTAADGRQFSAHVPWGDGTVYFDTGGCCGADTRLSGAAGDIAGWHHWAFVKQGVNKFIYKDGNVLLSQTGTATAGVGQIDEAVIGNFSATADQGIGGLMDEFAVYSHALTEAEIETLMTQGVPAIPEPAAALGLVALGGLATIRRRRARR